MNQNESIHPGEHLAEILDELGISQYRLAKTIGVPPRRINEIVHGRRSITADTALRIGQALTCISHHPTVEARDKKPCFVIRDSCFVKTMGRGPDSLQKKCLKTGES